MEWIMRAEKEPEPGTNVLAFWIPLMNCYECEYAVARYSATGHWHNPDNDEDDYRAPFAWMPLPEPPKEPR